MTGTPPIDIRIPRGNVGEGVIPAVYRPCEGCGYTILWHGRRPHLCGDCWEYGPPVGWRWERDPSTGKHRRIKVSE